MRLKFVLVLLSAMLGAVLAPFFGCTSGGASFKNTGEDDDGNSGGGGIDFNGDSGPPPCEGYACQVDNCNGNPDATKISGTVYAPNGTLPLYNVIVYVPLYPDGTLEPITPGASCDQCSATISNVVATALSDSSGHFEITAVPNGANIPLVVQIGKWRRKVILPQVQPCVDNPLTDPQLTRLPQSQQEGDIPQMNIVTGGCDPLPCLFRKMGLAASEFTASSGTGRMHVFNGIGGAGVDGGGAVAPEVGLWNQLETLMNYDISLFSCECSENNQTKTAYMNLMRDYLNAGGRMFATHYHYTWFKNNAAEPLFQTIANWMPLEDTYTATSPYTIDDTFPKGVAFVEWLHTVSPGIVGNQMNLNDIRNNVTTVNPGAQRWIYKPPTGVPELVKYLTFNTPIGIDPEEQCGRAVYSDIHVSSGFVSTVPSGCDMNPLTDQEKALIFLFFDLSACITPDGQPPAPPLPE